jgi:DNA-directed RNA polymerase specialized sigma24 family protein
MLMAARRDDTFEAFVHRHERRLRAALVLTYGPELGREATAEALAYAWEHWDRVATFESPVAYLYRVGQSRTRGLRRRRPRTGAADARRGDPWVEPGLPRALAELTDAQRVCTVLVCSYEWTYGEVADLLGVARSTVQSHVERGLQKLRAGLEVDDA